MLNIIQHKQRIQVNLAFSNSKASPNIVITVEYPLMSGGVYEFNSYQKGEWRTHGGQYCFRRQRSTDQLSTYVTYIFNSTGKSYSDTYIVPYISLHIRYDMTCCALEQITLKWNPHKTPSFDSQVSKPQKINAGESHGTAVARTIFYFI